MPAGLPSPLHALAAVFLTLPAHSQAQPDPLPTLPSPFTLPALPTRPGPLPGARMLLFDRDVLTDLRSGPAALRMRGLPLGDGRTLDLDLRRISVESRQLQFFVDDWPLPAPLANLDLSVFAGTIPGDPESHAMLGFSRFGVYGWLQTGGDLWHFLPRADERGDWSHFELWLTDEADLQAAELNWDFQCHTGRRDVAPREQPPQHSAQPSSPEAPTFPARGGPDPPAAPTCNLYACRTAIETDYQLFQHFGDLDAELSYLTMLLAWTSYRFEQQIETRLVYPMVRLYTSPNDPWQTPDIPGDTFDMLLELLERWEYGLLASGTAAHHIPVDVDLVHHLSGANLGGGRAFYDGICIPNRKYGVSGDISGNVVFPIEQHPSNYDFDILCHELGHNFGAQHTHDVCPIPIDSCAGTGFQGTCQLQQVCGNGTLMSYCNGCNGGWANVVPFLHPYTVEVMKETVRSCLDVAFGIVGEEVSSPLPPGGPSIFRARVGSLPQGPVSLHHRQGGTAWDMTAMNLLEGNLYAAELSSLACGLDLDYYFSYVDAECGPTTWPEGAPSAFSTAAVGGLRPLFEDNFETDQGWTVAPGSALQGQWQRSQPSGLGTCRPTTDSDGSGQAWHTQGAMSIGTTVLLSPSLDLSGFDRGLRYDYWAGLENGFGFDHLLVEIRDNTQPWPWTLIARHDSDSEVWRRQVFTHQDLLAAGLFPSNDMTLRFTGRNGEGGCISFGIDAFALFSEECVTDLGTPYCQSNPNSTGGPAQLRASGSASVAANALALEATSVPEGQPGLIYYGTGTLSLPFGNGTRCVGGFTGRLPEAVSQNGALRIRPDFTAPPNLGAEITAGSTWHFQAWFRDPGAGGSAFDLSDGLEITFGI